MRKNDSARNSSVRRAVPWYIKTIGMVLPLIFVVGAAELFLRLTDVDPYYKNQFFPVNRDIDFTDVYLRDADLFWRFRTDVILDSKRFSYISYRINSRGCRGFEPDPNPVDFRILALGNSCTFGWGVPWEDTWTNRLEKLIESESDIGNVEVINAGVPGYSSHQGKIYFKKYLLHPKPDMVLVTFGWNDHWVAGKGIPDAKQKTPARWVLALHNAVSGSKIFQVTRKLLLTATEKQEKVGLSDVGLCRVPLDQFYNNLVEIVDIALKENIEPVLITPPIASLEGYWGGPAISSLHQVHSSYQKVIEQVSRVKGVTLIDLQAPFDQYRNLFENAQADPTHYNSKGHRVAAEAIWDAIRPTADPDQERHPGDDEFVSGRR